MQPLHPSSTARSITLLKPEDIDVIATINQVDAFKDAVAQLQQNLRDQSEDVHDSFLEVCRQMPGIIQLRLENSAAATASVQMRRAVSDNRQFDQKILSKFIYQIQNLVDEHSIGAIKDYTTQHPEMLRQVGKDGRSPLQHILGIDQINSDVLGDLLRNTGITLQKSELANHQSNPPANVTFEKSKQGDDVEMILSFKRAIENLDPDNADYHEEFLNVCKQFNEFFEMKEKYPNHRGINPSFEEYCGNELEALKGQLDKAIHVYVQTNPVTLKENGTESPFAYVLNHYNEFSDIDLPIEAADRQLILDANMSESNKQKLLKNAFISKLESPGDTYTEKDAEGLNIESRTSLAEMALDPPNAEAILFLWREGIDAFQIIERLRQPIIFLAMKFLWKSKGEFDAVKETTNIDGQTLGEALEVLNTRRGQYFTGEARVFASSVDGIYELLTGAKTDSAVASEEAAARREAQQQRQASTDAANRSLKGAKNMLAFREALVNGATNVNEKEEAISGGGQPLTHLQRAVRKHHITESAFVTMFCGRFEGNAPAFFHDPIEAQGGKSLYQIIEASGNKSAITQIDTFCPKVGTSKDEA